VASVIGIGPVMSLAWSVGRPPSITGVSPVVKNSCALAVSLVTVTELASVTPLGFSAGDTLSLGAVVSPAGTGAVACSGKASLIFVPVTERTSTV
jgi:hypothetical protein